jgi:hypothetical protein
VTSEEQDKNNTHNTHAVTEQRIKDVCVATDTANVSVHNTVEVYYRQLWLFSSTGLDILKSRKWSGYKVLM